MTPVSLKELKRIVTKYNMNSYIALDFDGTCVDEAYPNIGEEVPNCISSLKKLEKLGYKFVLVTLRSGDKLTEAVEWLKQRGISISSKYLNPYQFMVTTSTKCFAKYIIDDTCVNIPTIHPVGFKNKCVDWETVVEIIENDSKDNTQFEKKYKKSLSDLQINILNSIDIILRNLNLNRKDHAVLYIKIKQLEVSFDSSLVFNEKIDNIHELDLELPYERSIRKLDHEYNL